MKKLIVTLSVILGLILIFLATGPFYTIDEGELAVVVRLGKIISVPETAGLHFKAPFLDKVYKYPKRILSWDGERQRILTRENQYIWVDTTARWRIADAGKFFESTTTLNAAFDRLSDIIDSAVRTVIAENWLREIVRNSNIILGYTGDEIGVDTSEMLDISGQEEEKVEAISKGRVNLATEMLELSKKMVPEYGIELIDIVPRQIKYSDELTESVYNRMIKERNQIAQAIRSEGEGKKAEWLGKLERERLTITSQAYQTSESIKGLADAKASNIYANAYNQDPEFFSFWKSMESYRQTLPLFEKTLSTDMDYFKYLYAPGRQ